MRRFPLPTVFCALSACRGETGEQAEPQPVAAPAVAPAVATESPPAVLPECKTTATFQPMSTGGAPPPEFWYLARIVGERIVVSARENDRVVSAAYDARADAWSSGGSFALTGWKRGDIPLVTEGDAHVAYRIVTDAGPVAVVSPWTGGEDPWRVSLPGATDMDSEVIAVGRELVVAPRDGCRFADWSRAQRLRPDPREVASLPAERAPSRRRGFTHVAADHIVVWGGELAPSAPPSDCDAEQPLATDGAVLDLAGPGWHALPAGPSGRIEHVEVDGERWLGFDTGGTGDAAVRLLDARARSWTEIVALARTQVDPPVGLHVASSPGHVAAFRTMPGATWGVVVDLETRARKDIGAPTLASWAASPMLDDRRLLVIPRESKAKEAYVLDLAGDGWCRLAWPVDAPFWREKGSPFYRVAGTIAGKLYLWSPGQSPTKDAQAGLVVTIPPSGA